MFSAYRSMLSTSGQLRMGLFSSTPFRRLTPASQNTAPTLTTISTLTGSGKNTEHEITYAALAAAANEADADGDDIVFRLEEVSTGTLTKSGGAVTEGVTTLGVGETFEWTPAVDATGNLNAFTVKAVDEHGASSASAIQVVVFVDPYLASDTFDRANNASLGNTDGGSLGPLAWTESTSAAFSISSNKLIPVTGDHTCWVDVSDADVAVTVTVNFEATEIDNLGVVARLSDNDNYLFAYALPATNVLRIYSKEAGSYTIRATSSPSMVGGVDYALAMTCVGTAISATVDGASQATWSSSFNQSATKHGMYSGNAVAGGATFNNFTVAAA